MADRIIVTRHPAAVEFIARQLARGKTTPAGVTGSYPDGSDRRLTGAVGRYAVHDGIVTVTCESRGDRSYSYEHIPIRASAGPDDVRGRVVYGNLPPHLAALAREVWAVEFAGAAPRGAEYTLADMDAAGARLVRYVVLTGERVDLARKGYDITV